MIKVRKLLEAPGFGLLVIFNFAHREANRSISMVQLYPKYGSRTMNKRISISGMWWVRDLLRCKYLALPKTL